MAATRKCSHSCFSYSSLAFCTSSRLARNMCLYLGPTREMGVWGERRNSADKVGMDGKLG